MTLQALNPLIRVGRVPALILNIILMVISVVSLAVEVGRVFGMAPSCQAGFGACKTPVCGYVLYVVLAGTGFINCIELRRTRCGRKPNVRFYLYNCMSLALALTIPFATVQAITQPEAAQPDRMLGAVMLNVVVPFFFVAAAISLALIVRWKMRGEVVQASGRLRSCSRQSPQ